jgi:hypothetical protein
VPRRCIKQAEAQGQPHSPIGADCTPLLPPYCDTVKVTVSTEALGEKVA